MKDRTIIITLTARCAGLALLLPALAILVWFGENSFDQFTRPLCPNAWWHEGAFWAHCAYGPFSISKYGLLYGARAVLGLALIGLAVPRYWLALGRLLLLAMMALPIYRLIFERVSWVTAAELSCLALLALAFELGMRMRMRSHSLRP